MKKIFIVLDVDNCKAIKAFRSESRADAFGDDYYFTNNIDTRVEEIWFDEVDYEDDD